MEFNVLGSFLRFIPVRVILWLFFRSDITRLNTSIAVKKKKKKSSLETSRFLACLMFTLAQMDIHLILHCFTGDFQTLNQND